MNDDDDRLVDMLAALRTERMERTADQKLRARLEKPAPGPNGAPGTPTPPEGLPAGRELAASAVERKSGLSETVLLRRVRAPAEVLLRALP